MIILVALGKVEAMIIAGLILPTKKNRQFLLFFCKQNYINFIKKWYFTPVLFMIYTWLSSCYSSCFFFANRYWKYDFLKINFKLHNMYTWVHSFMIIDFFLTIHPCWHLNYLTLFSFFLNEITNCSSRFFFVCVFSTMGELANVVYMRNI